MDVAHIGEVSHPRGDASQHAHQLDDGELTVVLLRGEPKNTHMGRWSQCVRMKGIYQLGDMTAFIIGALQRCLRLCV